jgi:ribosomal protein S8
MFNLHIAAKRLSFTLLFTKKNLNLIKLLNKLGLFFNFLLIKKKNQIYIKVLVRYRHLRKVGFNFKIITRPSIFYSLSLKALNLLKLRTGRAVYLLSTSKGIITHHEAINKNIGGIAVAFFSL